MDSKIALQNQGIPIYNKDPIKQLNEGKELVIAPKQEDILQKGKEIEDKELRALYFFLYQTGARISEALALKFGDVNEKSLERHRYAEARVTTLKNRKKGLRYIPIPLYIPAEAQMFEYFNDLYSIRINDVFMNVGTRNNVWDKFHKQISFRCEVQDLKSKTISMKEIPLHPHLLRHFRLTHLVTIYNYNVFQLMEFAGWSDTRQATTYVGLSSSYLAQPFASYKAKR